MNLTPVVEHHKKWNLWAAVIPGTGDESEPDVMNIIKVIRNGLPGSVLKNVAEVFQIPKSDMYELLHISPKTGQRFASKRLDKDKSDHIVQMIKIYYRAYDVFKDTDKAMKWLKSPCHALGDQIPVKLLDTTQGIDLIMDTLGRIEYGVFA